MNSAHTPSFASFLFRLVAAVGITLVMVASAMVGGIVRASGEEASQGDFRMGALTADCTFQTGGPLYGCTPWAGVEITFVVEESTGTRTETCTTADPGGPDARAASCGIHVEFGATVTVSTDPASVPAGYVLNQDATQVWTAPDGPPDGETGQPVFTLTATDDLPTSETLPDVAIHHRHQAQIVNGNCTSTGVIIANLAPVVPSVGDPVGQASAVEAETSVSTVAVGLDSIIDGPSAVVVYGGDGSDSVILACGDVGGVNDHDGELAVMLSPVKGSGAVGVARLAYNPSDAAMTDVTIYLVPMPGM